MSNPAEFVYDVFVSYSHEDKDWVESQLLPRLKAARIARRKVRVCIDKECFQAGVPVLDEIRRAITTSAKTLVVLSPAYLNSGWSNFEYTLQRTIDMQDRAHRLIPVLLRPCDLPPDIASLIYIDCTGDEPLKAQLDKVAEAITGTRATHREPGVQRDDTALRKYGPWLLLALAAAVVVLVLVRPGLPRRSTARPIVFVSQRDSAAGGTAVNWEVYSVKPDGSGLVRLTKHPASDQQAMWSPDGSKIAFVSDRDGVPEIYVMNPDGSHVQRVTHTWEGLKWYAWAPNSQKLVFEWELSGSTHRDIYTVDAAGAQQTPLSERPEMQWNASWSADSQRVVFVAQRGADPEIITMDANGGDWRQLTDDAFWEQLPTWCPDGSRVAFVTQRSGSWRAFAVQADGSGEYELLDDVDSYSYPVWSPDGKRVAVVGIRNGKSNIFVMNADGSSEIRLTDDAANDTQPAWSPDGKQIAFQSDRDGQAEIYVMPADGSGQAVRVTQGGGLAPSWAR
jgi:TolB protein